MNKIIAGLLGKDYYIDGIVVSSISWESHLKYLRALFERLLEFGLTINLSKSEFVVGNGEVAPIQSKVQGIFDFKIPENKKALMRFQAWLLITEDFVRIFLML